ncbi:hypothetical protein BDQ12DRAFT_721593 [Crucibulum laeve]|uniref:BED-type domain-containing protein n=1 Tax=Crucibulum laeve TaxID=68775 RepID=A0A5C3M664_9AGAR|nr:hypothetical protein BDQ12DRAFT_721593 [Crucibulum laeve]
MPPRKKKVSPKSKPLPNGMLETMFQVQLNINATEPTSSQNRDQYSNTGGTNATLMAATLEPQETPLLDPNPINDTGSMKESNSNREILQGDHGNNPFLDTTLPQSSSGICSSQSAEAIESDKASNSSESITTTHWSIQRNRQSHDSPRAGKHSKLRHRSPSPQTLQRKGAKDVWKFYQDVENTRGERHECILCRKQHITDPKKKIQDYSVKTSTSAMRGHLIKQHAEQWIQICDKLEISITASPAQAVLKEYRKRQGQKEDPDPLCADIPIPEFSNENFVNTIIRFIVDGDQSLNVIENEHLRVIFLMLRKELKDSDIPHRTHLRA